MAGGVKAVAAAAHRGLAGQGRRNSQRGVSCSRPRKLFEEMIAMQRQSLSPVAFNANVARLPRVRRSPSGTDGNSATHLPPIRPAHRSRLARRSLVARWKLWRRGFRSRRGPISRRNAW